MVDTMRKVKLFISVDVSNDPVAAPDDLTQTQYEALTWLQVSNVGSIGEMGTTTSILTYNTLDADVSDKDKGVDDAGDPEIEVAAKRSDLGQIAMRAAADTRLKYAFKEELNDNPGGTSNTIFYNRGLVAGPRRPQGRREDFDLEVFTLGLVQKEIKVDAVA